MRRWQRSSARSLRLQGAPARSGRSGRRRRSRAISCRWRARPARRSPAALSWRDDELPAADADLVGEGDDVRGDDVLARRERPELDRRVERQVAALFFEMEDGVDEEDDLELPPFE